MKAPASTQTEFEILSSGTHRAVCSQIVGIGMQETEWQGVISEKQRIKLRFEVPDERVTWETSDGESKEGPKIIWLTCTFSMHKNARLRKFIQSWLGIALGDKEAYDFDVDQMLGKACLISVVHNDWQGKTYANIDSISPLMRGMDVPVIEGESFCFDPYHHTPEEFDRLPEWLQELVNKGIELVREQERRANPVPQGFRDKTPVESENPAPAGDGMTDDDLPW